MTSYYDQEDNDLQRHIKSITGESNQVSLPEKSDSLPEEKIIIPDSDAVR
jgi:hypothetical protein